MKIALLAYLLTMGAEEHSHPLAKVDGASLLDRCTVLTDQPAFDFPISRTLGVKVDYEFTPDWLDGPWALSYSIALTR